MNTQENSIEMTDAIQTGAAEDLLNIGVVSEKTHLDVTKINFMVRQDLFPRPQRIRTPGGSLLAVWPAKVIEAWLTEREKPPVFCKDCKHFYLNQQTGAPARCTALATREVNLVHGYRLVSCKDERSNPSGHCGPTGKEFISAADAASSDHE